MPETVRAWMTHGVVAVEPDEPLFTGLEKMAEEMIRHVLVMRGKELLGILSNRDVVRATMSNTQRKLDLHGTLVSDVMTPAPLVTVSDRDPLSVAAEAFLYHKVNALPVLDAHDHVVGILTSEDILRSVFLAEAPTRRPDL